MDGAAHPSGSDHGQSPKPGRLAGRGTRVRDHWLLLLLLLLLLAHRGGDRRLVFLCLVLTGLRRAELQALRWTDVDLIENRLRVVDSKTETGSRSVAISPSLAERLWQHQRTSRYRADSNRVFCHPQAGTVYRYETFSEALRRTYTAAGMRFPEGMRPLHDLRRARRTTRSRARTRSR